MKLLRLACIALALTGCLACDANEPNPPPSDPTVISGMDSAGVDQRVEVTVVARTPDGEALSLEVDWGDGRPADLYPDIESGLHITIAHYYFTSGRYSMRCRAISHSGRISAWSAPFAISIEGETRVGRGDWWMFMRDAQHSGHSPFAGPSTPILAWRLRTPAAIRSSPVFDVSGTIHIGGDDFLLRAVYPDGAIKWSYSTGNAWIHNAPAIHDDGSVSFAGSSANIYRLGWDGEKLWNYSVNSPIVRSSVTLDENGNIYVGSRDHTVYSLRPDGSLRWRVLTNGPVEGSPALSLDQRTLYIGSQDRIMYAIDTDGRTVWTFPTAAPFTGSPSVGPTGNIHIGNEAGMLYALRSDGGLAWQRDLRSPIVTTPAVTRDAFVHVITSEGKLFRLNSAGEVLWDVFIALAGGDGSPVVDVYGNTYVGTPDGRLTAVSSDGHILWRFETGEAIHSTPGIGPDGSVVFGSDDGHCYVLRGH